MILDNLILDVKGYEHHHPGGRFVMQRNLGRDISKYFYGGYTMMAGRQPQRVHSVQAMAIAKRMVVGYMAKQVPVDYVSVKCELGYKVNSTSSVFYLSRANGTTPVPNFKRFYRDIKEIGRHFVIYKDEDKNMIGKPLKRQYTICNAMEANMKQALL